ncbi:MAG: hypothetical protein KR126chlam2_00610 [Chlamydiae bacterium]|nr:hypothetical protein [Chlamydiota bacterium]
MGATSFYTPELGQNGLDKWIVTPLQFVARVVYLLVVGLLIAPIGALYHAVGGIYYHCSKPTAEGYEKEHFKAALQDLTSITGLRHLRFCVKPHRAVPPLFSTTEIKIIEYQDLIYPYNALITASLNIRQTQGMSRLPESQNEQVIHLLDQMKSQSGQWPSRPSVKESAFAQRWQASQAAGQ